MNFRDENQSIMRRQYPSIYQSALETLMKGAGEF